MRTTLTLWATCCCCLLSFGQNTSYSFEEGLLLPGNHHTSESFDEGASISGITPTGEQDKDWSTAFSVPGILGDIYCSATDGQNLYLAGNFRTAGDKIANSIVMWDGQDWQSIGEGGENGINGDVPTIHAVAVANGALFVAGQFTQAGSKTAPGVAYWDGDDWQTLGEAEALRRLIVVNNDTLLLPPFIYALYAHGDRLYVGGDFQLVDGRRSPGVAAWNMIEQRWENMGSGLENPVELGSAVVSCFAAVGEELYVGGNFQRVDGKAYTNIAKWDGQHWLSAGNADHLVHSLQVDPKGRLIAAGIFTTIGGVKMDNSIAVLENGIWEPAFQSGNLNVNLRKLLFTEEGAVGIGTFERRLDGYYSTLAKWDGQQWEPRFDLGLMSNEHIPGTAVIMESIGNKIFVGGAFTRAGERITNNIVEWEPATNTWNNLWDGKPHKGMYDGNVLAFADYQGQLYAGGTFSIAGGMFTRNIARWDGNGWHAVGENYNNGVRGVISAMTANDEYLFVGGYFGVVGSVEAYHVGKWNGTEWSSVGIGVGGLSGAHVNALAVVGNYLYVGGYFAIVGDEATYDLRANSIARFNLDTQRWESVGAGVEFTMGLTGIVYDFAVAGDSLFVVGEFNDTDGIYSPNVGLIVDGKWENTNRAYNLGLEGSIRAVQYIDGELLAGGILQLERNAPSVGIARWHNNKWEAVAEGVFASNEQPFVNDIQPYDNGFVVGGYFQRAGQTEANNIAYFDGTNWQPLGSGIRPGLYAMAVKDDQVFAGSSLMFSGSTISAGLALYQGETTVDTKQPVLIERSLLQQNRPNPSRHSTTIAYTVPAAGKVRMVLYDAQGRLVRTLLNAQLPSGEHYLEVPTHDLPAGVYHYQLETGGFSDVRKMIIVR